MQYTLKPKGEKLSQVFQIRNACSLDQDNIINFC